VTLVADPPSLVLFITEFFQPIGGLTVDLFHNGDVRHGGGGGGAVPMLLTRRKPDDVSRPDFFDGSLPSAGLGRSLRLRPEFGPRDGCAMRFGRQVRT